jgi:hypothetical protein
MPAHRAGGEAPRSLPPGEIEEHWAVGPPAADEQLTLAPALGPSPTARDCSAATSCEPPVEEVVADDGVVGDVEPDGSSMRSISETIVNAPETVTARRAIVPAR